MELAEALIEEHGHTVGDSGDAQTGWSIHGAVGEAARRISDSADKGDSYARPLRDKAARRIEAVHGTNEMALNDTLDKDGAIAALREARESDIQVT